jgi:hypothetical protein
MPWQRKRDVPQLLRRFKGLREACNQRGLVTPEGNVSGRDAGGYHGRSQTRPGMQGSRGAYGRLT